MNRRDLLCKGGAVALSSLSATRVVRGQTSSGDVEIQVTASLPTDTFVSVTIFEDLTDDGTVDNQQQQVISDGTNTYVCDALEGVENDGVHYYADVVLSTDDDSVTPSVDSMTLTLPSSTQTTAAPTTAPPGTTQPPDGPSEDSQSAFGIWENYLVFVAIVVMSFTALGGLASRSMAVGVLGGYLVFAYIAVTTGTALLINILYLTLVVIIIGMAMKIWRTEFGGSI